MKYKIYKLLAIIFWYTTICPLDDYTNQTFMFTRPIFNAISIEQASWHSIVYNKQKYGVASQITALYGQSYENLLNSAYFLFDLKNRITISAGDDFSGTSKFMTSGPGAFQVVENPQIGQMYVNSYNRDVLGQWVDVYTTKNLWLELHPRQRQACALLELSQDLKSLFSWSIFENWFINIAAPVTWIENNLGIEGDKEAIESFNRPEFSFIKMNPCDQTSVRLTQATITLGTKYQSENDVQIITTTGVIVPLVEQNNHGILFEPIQGFNAHFGFDTKVHFQFPIVKKTPDSSSRILMFVDIHNNFLARNHQLRTYDIKNKPFSRYMKLIDNHTNELIPAMNALTIRSRVEPFNIVDFATGFRFSIGDCYGDIGYELWAHGTERVTPEPKQGQALGNWDDNRYGIAFIDADGNLAKINTTTGAVVALGADELGQTASNSTINFIAAPDGEFSCCPSPTFLQKNKYLKIKDLDHFSAAARSTITHRAFMTVGVGQKGKRIDSFANFGAFIEASQNNAALCFWGAWFKAGLTF